MIATLLIGVAAGVVLVAVLGFTALIGGVIAIEAAVIDDEDDDP